MRTLPQTWKKMTATMKTAEKMSTMTCMLPLSSYGNHAIRVAYTGLSVSAAGVSVGVEASREGGL